MGSALLAWFNRNGRDLPWRRTRDPYAILVSEVMLHQTQVNRVLPRYLAWLARWPDVHTLAEAPLGDAIREWQGLGYNRRAINLHRAARIVAADGWPDDMRLSDIEQRFICKACGKRGADLRPDFNWNSKPVAAMGYR